VSVGPQGKEKTIDSKRLDGELYGSIEEVQGVLKDRLDGFINQIVSDAQKKVSSWYGTKTATLNASRNEDQNGKVDPESLIDEIDSPPEPIISAKRTAAKTRTSAEEARRKAVASIVGLEEQQSSPTDENSEFIELPGGQKVKVNIKTA
jgi:hypothetical protein